MLGSGAKTLNFRYSPQFIFIPEVLMDKLKDFKWKHFQPDIILLCVRWYLRYSLSYRDLVEMMEERGLSLAHTTIMRWIHEYAPKIDKRTVSPNSGKLGIRGWLMRRTSKSRESGCTSIGR